jgi:hypothetical protein
VKLLLLLLVVSSTNLLYLSYNTIPPHMDLANHMTSALKYHQVMSDFFQQPDLLSFKSIKAVLRNLVEVDQNVYPPLFPFVASFAVFFAGSSIKWLAMTQVFFMAILLYTLYQIGKKLRDEESGILAGVMILLYPMVFGSSREFMLEFPLLAITALSCYFLLYSEEFHNHTFTVLFGLSIGLGMLTKMTYVSYIVGPLGYVTWLVISKIRGGKVQPAEGVRRFCRLLVALVLGLLLAGLWYVPNYSSFLSNFRNITSLNPTGLSIFDVDSLLYFLNAMIEYQIGLPFFILFIYGLSRLGRSVNKTHAWFLLVWAFSIYLIHTFATHKNNYQDIGILLPVGIISAIAISTLRQWKKAIVTLVLLFGFLQFATLSLPEPWLAKRLGKFEWAGHYHVSFPRSEDWKIEDALRSLGDQTAKVAVISDHGVINGTTIRFYVSSLRLPLVPFPCHELVGERKDLRTFDFVITKSDTDWLPRGPKGAACFGGVADYLVFLKQLEDKNGNFSIFSRTPLPDGSEMLIYKRV